MLEIFGVIAANVLSLPGVLGMTLGMLTRHFGVALLLGGAVGLLEAAIFADFSFPQVEQLELVMSIIIGCAASSIGCAFRRKGTFEIQNESDASTV